MFRNVMAALCLAAMVPVAAAQDAPEVLKRSEQWTADYDDDSCHLYTQLGTGDAAVIARFTRYDISNRFELRLYGKRFRSPLLRSDVELDFGLPGGVVQKRSINGETNGMGMMVFTYLRLDGEPSGTGAVTREMEAQVTSLTLSVNKGDKLRLDFGSLGKPMATMSACTEDLVKSWGYDPDEQFTLSAHLLPIGNPAEWLSSRDFPDGAEGMRGLVQIRLDADPTGKAVGCHVIGRTDPVEFAKASCRLLMRRASFKPARNAAGVPVASYMVRTIQWGISE